MRPLQLERVPSLGFVVASLVCGSLFEVARNGVDDFDPMRALYLSLVAGLLAFAIGRALYGKRM